MSDRLKNYVTRSATNDPVNEDKEGFYPTPEPATRAMLALERFKGRIWEPACGDGAISRLLLAAGYEVASTDLHDRGYGVPGVDFLTCEAAPVDNVVTNPPFKLAEAFVHRALAVARHQVVILNRLSWLEGKGRYKSLFDGNSPLARVWVFSSRLHFLRSGDVNQSGGGMVAFAWYVWEKGHSGPVTLGWLPPFEKET
jgi:hypothetical protein